MIILIVPIFVSYMFVLNLGGAFYLGELLFSLAGFYFFWDKRFNAPINSLESFFFFKKIFFSLVLLGLIQAFSDYINKSELSDSVKGVSALLLAAICFAGVFGAVIFVKNSSSGIYFSALILFYAVSYLIFREGDWRAIWKSHMSMALILCIMLSVAMTVKKNILPINLVICIFWVPVSLLADFRSAAGLVLASLLISVLADYRKVDVIPQNIIKRNFFLSSIILIAIVLPVNYIATFLAKKLLSINSISFYIDQVQIDKYRSQAEGNLGILFGGRSEWLVAFDALSSNFFYGHGSWPKDTGYFSIKLRQISENFGYIDPSDPIFYSEYIPTHSVILQGFVWSGFFGGVVWFYILLLCIANSITAIKYGHKNMRFAVSFSMLYIIWSILFSPFGYQLRAFLPLLMVVSALSMKMAGVKIVK